MAGKLPTRAKRQNSGENVDTDTDVNVCRDAEHAAADAGSCVDRDADVVIVGTTENRHFVDVTFWKRHTGNRRHPFVKTIQDKTRSRVRARARKLRDVVVVVLDADKDSAPLSEVTGQPIDHLVSELASNPGPAAAAIADQELPRPAASREDLPATRSVGRHHTRRQRVADRLDVVAESASIASPNTSGVTDQDAQLEEALVEGSCPRAAAASPTRPT